MPDLEYAKAPGIRCTLVKNYFSSGSPYEFYMKNIHEDKPPFQSFNPAALELGKAVHAYVLEPENWERDFKVIPSDTRRGTIAYRKLLAENKGKTLIKEIMFKDVKKIRDSVFKNKGAEKLLTRGKSEASVFWKEGNQAFKCRFDYLTDSGIVIDLKTCQDSNPRNFLKSIVNFNYDIQNDTEVSVSDSKNEKTIHAQCKNVTILRSTKVVCKVVNEQESDNVNLQPGIYAIV